MSLLYICMYLHKNATICFESKNYLEYTSSFSSPKQILIRYIRPEVHS